MIYTIKFLSDNYIICFGLGALMWTGIFHLVYYVFKLSLNRYIYYIQILVLLSFIFLSLIVLFNLYLEFSDKIFCSDGSNNSNDNKEYLNRIKEV